MVAVAAAIGAAVLQGAQMRKRLRGKQAAESYLDRLSAPTTEEPAGPAMKMRPAASLSRHLCHGRAGAPCVFSTATSGARARYQSGSKQCPWCNDALMTQALAAKGGKGRLSRSLSLFWQHNKAIFQQAKARLPEHAQQHLVLQALGLPRSFHSKEAIQQACQSNRARGRLLTVLRQLHAEQPDVARLAVEALPEEHQGRLDQEMKQEPRRQRQEAARQEKDRQWDAAMAARRSIRAKPTEEDRHLWDGRVADDRARVQRKFFPNHLKIVKHTGHQWSNPMPEELRESVQDIAPNDTGLPAAQVSPVATMLEQWCKLGSWGVCGKCHSIDTRHLKEVDARRVAKQVLASCRWCRGSEDADVVPQPSDTPKALRKLNTAIIAALCPLELDCGPYERPLHGYRIHTALVRLSWAAESVKHKIKALSRQHRKKAKKAYQFLMGGDSRSEYHTFVLKHEDFLRQNADPSDADRKRPLQMMEVP